MYPLTKKEASTALGGLFQCQLREDAVRKDWQRRVAEYSMKKQNEDNVSNECRYEENFELSCGGYLERTGLMRTKDSTDVPPLAVLIHGFGGSMDQMKGMAKELQNSGFGVLGIDLIGFGRSEKPPLSYNQYFWRDQVITAVNRHLERSGNQKRKVVFLEILLVVLLQHQLLPPSLILSPQIPMISWGSREQRWSGGSWAGSFNSAGKIIDPISDSTTKLIVQEEMDKNTELYETSFIQLILGHQGHC